VGELFSSEVHLDDEMEAFSAVSLRCLGGEKTKRIKKWLEDHPGEGLKKVNPGMSQHSLPIAHGKKHKTMGGLSFGSLAMDDSSLLQNRRSRFLGLLNPQF
jgi:hypothetical protein